MEERNENSELQKKSADDTAEKIETPKADGTEAQPQATEQTVESELPKWWRLDDKIPSDRAEVAPSNTGAFLRTVYGKDAKIYNIITLVFLAVVLITMVVGFFSPVFAVNDTCDGSAVIVESESNGIRNVRYVAVRQSGFRLIKGMVAMFERNDNKAEKLKAEHSEALNKIQFEYMQWMAEHFNAESKEAQNAYEKIFVKYMSETDFAGYLATLPFTQNSDTLDVIKTVMPVFMIGLAYLIGALSAILAVIVNATKTVTELANKSEKILFWNQMGILFTYSMLLFFVNVGNPITMAYLLCPIILHIALSFAIGLHYAKKNKKLDVKLVLKSMVSPILVPIGLGLISGTANIIINDGMVRYGDSLFAPVIKIIESAILGRFNYMWIIIVFGVILIALIVLAVFQQRSNKKRASYGVGPIFYSTSCSYSRIGVAIFLLAIIETIIGACTGVIKIYSSALLYVGVALCIAPLIAELVMKTIDYRKKIKTIKAILNNK